MNNEMRRMTQDLPSPMFDGRARYGVKAIRLLAEGDLVMLSPQVDHIPAFLQVSSSAGTTMGQIDPSFHDAILAASEADEPRNWEEVRFRYEIGGLVSEVLQRLLDGGKLQLADLVAAAKDLSDRP